MLSTSTILFGLHVLLLIAISARVIMRRPAPGVALAWILLVSATSLLGACLYLMIGERRIGSRRSERLRLLRSEYAKIANKAIRHGVPEVDWSPHADNVQGLDRLGRHLAGIATVPGNDWELISDTGEILDRIASDIDGACSSVLMEFYIWESGGRADDVLNAVIRAAERGVFCCLLIDAVGAHAWWRGDQPKRLRKAGVHLMPALPVGLLRTFIGRTDLRLHRKIVVIDGDIAWTGSMNLVDPRFFKQGSGVGEWVDAMVRLRGFVIAPLAATMIADWILETGESLESVIDRAKLKTGQPEGRADMQVVPSGPGQTGDVQLQMILAMINSAKRELTMTTPYLVPDESLLRAIRGAAGRGVRVRLVVPKRVDSLLTRYASRSFFVDLLQSGVEIYLYRDGLLHTKSVSVDGACSIFGTANLDMRSLWLNYEVNLFIYDADFTSALRDLQQAYIAESDRLDMEAWNQRRLAERFLENTMRLASPLL